MQGQGRPRFHTAPSRMRKRDVPAVWDLFALDDRANPAPDDDDASSVASLSHPPSVGSLGSFASEDTQQSGDMPPMVDRGGSWPRVRKQRTSDLGSSMSLFEVAEALGTDENSADADLASLAKLVAAEEAEMSTTPDETSNVSIESFVDAVFLGITPGSAAAAPQPPNSAATAAARAASASPAAASVEGGGSSASVKRTNSSRRQTANDLALLRALKQDAAANAAGAETLRRSSPTFAACVGGLDMAGDAQEPTRDIETDEVVRRTNRPPARASPPFAHFACTVQMHAPPHCRCATVLL